MHYIVLSECNIKSGRNDATVMYLVNISWVFMSTINCQSFVEDNRSVLSPSLSLSAVSVSLLQF